MSVVFLLYSSALQASLARVQGFSLMVTTQNSTALKVNSMTEDIFIYNSFSIKKFLHPVTRYKKAYVYAHNFSVSFFSSYDIHQSQYLDGCQVIVINSFFVFDNHRTIQKIYLHHYHHPNDHHHHHNCHHATYLPPHL